MNENSPICASATATESASRNGYPATRTIMAATNGFPRMTTASAARSRSGASSRDQWVEQHADGHEEEHGKRVAHRQCLGCGTVAVVGASDDHTGQKRAERY